jgi:hypothetical protein
MKKAARSRAVHEFSLAAGDKEVWSVGSQPYRRIRDAAAMP